MIILRNEQRRYALGRKLIAFLIVLIVFGIGVVGFHIGGGGGVVGFLYLVIGSLDVLGQVILHKLA